MSRFFRNIILGASSLFALFGFVTNASAAYVDDVLFSSVSASGSSTASSATGVTYTVNFTTTATINSGEQIEVYTNTNNCNLNNWDNCLINLSTATASGSGLSGSVAWQTSSGLAFQLSSSLAAGSYTLTLANVSNPTYAGGSNRFYMRSSMTDSSGYSNETAVQTNSDPIIIGTPLATGTITKQNGDPLQTYGTFHNEDWSLNVGMNADQWGHYAVANPGFSSGSSVILTVYPEASTGYFSTSSTFTYDGSTATVNMTPDRAVKTISGTITYSDTGEAVTSASVVANSPSSWGNATPDSNGAYELAVGGGTYNVCAGDLFDSNGRRVKRDWYSTPGEECTEVVFAKDSTAESATVNIQVNRADANAIGIMKNPDGSFPSQGGWVSFSNNTLWFGGNVDSNDGTFDIAVVGGNSSQVQSTSLISRAVASTSYMVSYSAYDQNERTYWDEDSVTITADTTTDLGTITLKERTVVYTATVEDADGNPVPDIWVNAWIDGGNGWVNVKTNSVGVAVLYLYPAKWNVQPSTWNTSSFIFTGPSDNSTFIENQTVSKTFTVTRTTLSVNVSLRSATGELAPVNGWANCWSPAPGGGYGFGGSIQGGSSTFGAVAGDYFCNAWINDENYQATGDAQVTFEDGVDENIEFDVQERSSTLTVSVKDQDNKLITSNKARVSANSANGGWSEGRVNNGVAELRLAPGAYHVNVWFEGQGQPGGGATEYIASWSSGKDVVLKENDSKSRVITVQAVSGTLTATLKDTDGNPVPNAWVGCGNWRELDGKVQGDFDGGRVIESGSSSGADGVAVVPLVKKHEYECWVGVPKGAGLVGPGSQDVSLLNKANVTSDFVFQATDSTISGSAVLVDTQGNATGEEISQMWCSAWADEGYSAFSESFDADFSLDVINGTWHMWCGTEVINDDGTRTFYHPENDTTVEVTEESDTVVGDIELSSSIFEVPEPLSETFDSTASKTITLPDGAVLTIPAGALATSGNVTVTAEPEVGANRTFSDSPYGVPWNFEAFDSSNSLISGDFNSQITLTVSYDEDKLEQLEIDEENILPKYWDDSNSSWQNVDNASQDTDTNTVSFTLSHFTTVGLTYNKLRGASITKPNKPRKTKVKNVLSASALLDWMKPTGPAVGSYKLQLRKFKVKKTKKWTKLAKIKKTQKKVQGLEADTRYQFRVRGCVSGQCSGWTKWKAFRTAS